MVSQPEVLAIVQARGGSKSIPRKNVKMLGGVPLIAYSIIAGLEASLVSRVIVSTDDDEIAAVAQQWGAEVPFRRPAELASDHALDLELFQHALGWLEEHEGYRPDFVVQLRPTSPFRPPDCVDQGIRLLMTDPKADSVRAVVSSGQNPYKMWRIGSDGTMQPLLDEGFVEPYNMPRQALPPTYWQTGHLDVLRTETIMQQHSMSGQRILSLVLDPGYTIDIDTLLDWDRAEWMLERTTLPLVRPVNTYADIFANVQLVVLDFDGVLTDNRVWVSETGTEFVAAHRGDGMGIAALKKIGVEVIVISKETNPVVAARCRKLDIPYQQGIDEKKNILEAVIAERGLTHRQVIYVGNDINDLECMQMVGLGVAVADAHPSVLSKAGLVLRQKGGLGAVRELCDQILIQKANTHA